MSTRKGNIIRDYVHHLLGLVGLIFTPQASAPSTGTGTARLWSKISDGKLYFSDATDTDNALASETFVTAAVNAPVPASRLKVFHSAQQTANGSSQSIAHGLGATPAFVIVTVDDDTAAQATGYAIVQGTHDGTNVKVTITTGVKYRVVAFA